MSSDCAHVGTWVVNWARRGCPVQHAQGGSCHVEGGAGQGEMSVQVDKVVEWNQGERGLCPPRGGRTSFGVVTVCLWWC